MAQALTHTTNLKGWKSWTSQKTLPQGVVKRDWVATGRIDFATRLNGDAADADQPSEFKLLVEERRIVESIAGNENLEISMEACYAKGGQGSRNSIPQIPVGKLAHQNCSRDQLSPRGGRELHRPQWQNHTFEVHCKFAKGPTSQVN